MNITRYVYVWNTLKHISRVRWLMLFSAAMTAQIWETKQPMHKRMAQHRWDNSSGQDSAVHPHLKKKGHSFDDNNVNVLAGEDRWFERLETGTCIFEQRRWPEDITYHPPTMQHWVPSPDSLTTIHTWSHLALMTYMNVVWLTCDPRDSGKSHTEFKSCISPPVR